MKIGLLASAFDILHPGIVWTMRQACEVKQLKCCDSILACIHEDPSIENPKKRKPILSVNERAIIVCAIKFVHDVRSYKTEADLYRIMRTEKIDVVILGEDHREDKWTGFDLGIPAFFAKRSPEWSCTAIYDRIVKRILEGLP